jgi:hypothetical protein
MSVQTTYLTDPPIGYAGQLVGSEHRLRPMRNADVTSMPYGVAVGFKTTGAGVTDQDAMFPGVLEIAGIVTHNHSASRSVTLTDGSVAGGLDATGKIVGEMFDVLEEGEVIVKCVDGVTQVGARLWIVKADGTLRTSDPGGGLAVDATRQGRWLSTCGAGGLARLAVDFTARAT